MAEKFAWNDAQQTALNAPRENLLVSAAAGSGKTAVLTERIFSLLTDKDHPIPFSDIVAITFTRSAAASLKEKLAERIERAVAEDPKNALLRKLSLELPHASISTVHSFCMRIITENAALLNLPPRLSLADDAVRDRMQKNCMRKAINKVFSDADSKSEQVRAALKTAYYLMNQEKKTEITDLPLRIYDQLMSLEEGVGKLLDLTREARKELAAWETGDATFFSTPAGKLGKEQALITLKAIQGRLKIYFNSFPAEDAEDENVLPHAHELSRAVNVAKSLVEREDFDAFLKLCKSFTPLTYKNKSREFPPSSPEGKRCKAFYDTKIKEPVTSLFSDYNTDTARLIGEEKHRLCTQEIFCELLSEFSALYQEEKREAALLDYSDLEHMALTVLRAKEKGAAPYCRALFVDEYQDTNRLQDVIFRECVKNEGFFFFVGDVKQSIYRFRHAAPELFLSYKNEFPDIQDTEQKTALGKSIFLSENFRSDHGVINFTNRIFHVLMNDQEEENLRMYSERDALKKGKKEERGEAVEFYILDKKPQGASISQEALITERVLKLVRNEGRAPEEIAVITYTNSFLQKVRRALSKAGVPVTEGNADLHETTEVQTLKALLKVLDNPLSDIDLVSLCTSPLFAFTSDELFTLRSYCDGSFWNALLAAADENNLSAIAPRARALCDWVNQNRAQCKTMRISAFLLRLFDEGGAGAALGAGERMRSENLMKVYREIRDFEANGRRTLGEVLTYLDNRERQSSNTESDAEVHKGCVTLMTVHKSKGLEFPVCIFAQLGRTTRAEVGTFLDPARGLYHRLYDEERHAFSTALSDKIARKHEGTLSREEAKRLLYVGMTRAKEKLILIDGASTDLGKRFAKAGVFPYLPGESIHSRDLNTAGDMLLYSLRDDEQLQHFAALYETNASARDTLACAGIEISFIGHDTLIAPEEAEKTIGDADASSPRFCAEECDALSRALDAYARRAEEILLPSKLSVSELLHMKSGESKEGGTHLSFDPDDRRGASHGTAMHSFMQFCDFERAKASPEHEAARLADLAFLTEEQAKGLNFYALSRFFDSKTFAAIEKSPRVKRELRFNVFLKADEVLGADAKGELLIQGVIDCFYEKEDGTYAILDFKTDAVNPKDGEEILLSRHARQLQIYARALEEMSGKKVTSLALYSFALSREINVPQSN
ncbi:MAG: UvrD-helicase domain-containing protein [Clostridia bacterium]|nr:UvrD-helicase domain-containing protein [Clostridia bacterium]